MDTQDLISAMVAIWNCMVESLLRRKGNKRRDAEQLNPVISHIKYAFLEKAAVIITTIS